MLAAGAAARGVRFRDVSSVVAQFEIVILSRPPLASEEPALS
jgi:hypothetical protein